MGFTEKSKVGGGRGAGFTKKQGIEGIAEKGGGLGQFADLMVGGGLGNKYGGWVG